MKPVVQYTSFVIRLWQSNPDNEAAQRILKGSLEHIQSGEMITITSLEEIQSLIRNWLGRESADSGEST